MSGDALSCSACGYENVVAGCGFCLQCGAEFDSSPEVVQTPAPLEDASLPVAEPPLVQAQMAAAAAPPNVPTGVPTPQAVGAGIAPTTDEVVSRVASEQADDVVHLSAHRDAIPVPSGGTRDYQNAIDVAEQSDYESGNWEDNSDAHADDDVPPPAQEASASADAASSPPNPQMPRVQLPEVVPTPVPLDSQVEPLPQAQIAPGPTAEALVEGHAAAQQLENREKSFDVNSPGQAPQPSVEAQQPIEVEDRASGPDIPPPPPVAAPPVQAAQDHVVPVEGVPVEATPLESAAVESAPPEPASPMTASEVPSDVVQAEVAQPEVVPLEVAQQEAGQAEVVPPEVAHPEVVQSEVAQQEAGQPEVVPPEVAHPEVVPPEVAQQVVAQPELDQPELDQPELAQPEVDQPEPDHIEDAGVEPAHAEPFQPETAELDSSQAGNPPQAAVAPSENAQPEASQSESEVMEYEVASAEAQTESGPVEPTQRDATSAEPAAPESSQVQVVPPPVRQSESAQPAGNSTPDAASIAQESSNDGFDLPAESFQVGTAMSAAATEVDNAATDSDPDSDGPVSFSKSLAHELHATIVAAADAAGMRLREEDDRLVAQLVIEGRPQLVYVERSFTSDVTPVLSLYAVCGPASTNNALPLLEWNRALALCAFAVRDVGGRKMFVIQSNLLAFSVDHSTLRRTLVEIAKRANQVNERLLS